MRPGTRRQIAYEIRTIKKTAERLAADVERAELPDLRRVGVDWGSVRKMIVGGTYVLREERHVVEIIRSLAWGLFELKRNGSDSTDPIALAEVRAILVEIGEKILHGVNSSDRCKKCGGLQRICLACDGECQVPYSENTQETHDRATTLCPECSSWLAPPECR